MQRRLPSFARRVICDQTAALRCRRVMKSLAGGSNRSWKKSILYQAVRFSMAVTRDLTLQY
jgi:hypothetical protein